MDLIGLYALVYIYTAFQIKLINTNVEAAYACMVYVQFAALAERQKEAYTAALLVWSTSQSDRHVTHTSSVLYLCVHHDSSNAVVCPEQNISQPACAIIAPLSMQ